MAKVIVDRGLFDARFLKAHCRNVEAFLEAVHAYDVLWAADICGIAPELIEEAAVTYGRAPAAAILFSTGVEASGVEAIQALVNLALLTGNIGKAGAGVFALTEHNNLQGSATWECCPTAARLAAAVADRRDAAPSKYSGVRRFPTGPGRGRKSSFRGPARAPSGPCGSAATIRSWPRPPTPPPFSASSTWSSSSIPSSPRRPSTRT
jgi:formate dehydrogenase major subunit